MINFPQPQDLQQENIFFICRMADIYQNHDPLELLPLLKVLIHHLAPVFLFGQTDLGKAISGKIGKLHEALLLGFIFFQRIRKKFSILFSWMRGNLGQSLVIGEKIYQVDLPTWSVRQRRIPVSAGRIIFGLIALFT